MDCAAKGKGTGCVGAATRRCARCGAVGYCSLGHQIAHWSHHKQECERLEQQMKSVDDLNDFPFTFSREATFEICEKQQTRCSFLSKRGLHKRGMWLHECHCGASCTSFDCLGLNNGWDLPRTLCPCFGPNSIISEELDDWEDYYKWRSIPLDSPVALLLHWPLTIYYAAQLIGFTMLNREISDKLCIHYLELLASKTSESIGNIYKASAFNFQSMKLHLKGPEKELLQLAVFGELQALFPGIDVHIDFVGPAIPEHRDGERISISGYAYCNEDDCACKLSSENEMLGTQAGITSAVTLKLWRGFYHDRYRDVVKDSFPNMIIAPNAGIAAYSSWLPSIELMEKINVPVIFTDYCEEACHLAASCINSVTGRSLTLPVQLNPFRQPMVVEHSVLLLPCFSNCFLFGI